MRHQSRINYIFCHELLGHNELCTEVEHTMHVSKISHILHVYTNLKCHRIKICIATHNHDLARGWNAGGWNTQYHTHCNVIHEIIITNICTPSGHVGWGNKNVQMCYITCTESGSDVSETVMEVTQTDWNFRIFVQISQLIEQVITNLLLTDFRQLTEKLASITEHESWQDARWGHWSHLFTVAMDWGYRRKPTGRYYILPHVFAQKFHEANSQAQNITATTCWIYKTPRKISISCHKYSMTKGVSSHWWNDIGHVIVTRVRDIARNISQVLFPLRCTHYGIKARKLSRDGYMQYITRWQQRMGFKWTKTKWNQYINLSHKILHLYITLCDLSVVHAAVLNGFMRPTAKHRTSLLLPDGFTKYQEKPQYHAINIVWLRVSCRWRYNIGRVMVTQVWDIARNISQVIFPLCFTHYGIKARKLSRDGYMQHITWWQ